MNAKMDTSTHAHQRINHLAQVVHLCTLYFSQMLLTKTTIVQCMVYMRHTKASITYAEASEAKWKWGGAHSARARFFWPHP